MSGSDGRFVTVRFVPFETKNLTSGSNGRFVTVRFVPTPNIWNTLEIDFKIFEWWSYTNHCINSKLHENLASVKKI